MQLIFNKQNRRNYVAAVYERHEDAKAFVSLCENRDELLVYGMRGLSYPFFIVEMWDSGSEDDNTLIALRDQESLYFVIDQITRAMPEAEDRHEHTYLNVYEIKDDFHGNQEHPGRDHMGALSHDHVDDAWLDSLDAGEMPGIQWKPKH
jgi:hypothetical protein